MNFAAKAESKEMQASVCISCFQSVLGAKIQPKTTLKMVFVPEMAISPNLTTICVVSL